MTKKVTYYEKHVSSRKCISFVVRVISCLRRCPWNFECVIVYAWYECHYLIGAGTEAELLVELLTSWAVLLQSSPDLFDNVRELGRRIKVLLEKAALYFCC